jgi:hypothetical protein
MPAAWDIMKRFPCPNTAPLTETCAFRETFGTSLHLVEKLWFLIDKEELQPVSSCPEHLLWVLHFMKVYSKQAPGCAVVGVSSGAINPKTHQKWVWAYIEAVAELVDKVVSIFTYTCFAWAGGTFFPVVLLCCVSFWLWQEKGFDLHTHVLLRVQYSCGGVLVI